MKLLKKSAFDGKHVKYASAYVLLHKSVKADIAGRIVIADWFKIFGYTLVRVI